MSDTPRDAPGGRAVLRPLTWPARRPRTTIAIAIVLSVLSLAGVSRIRPDASLEAMFSPADPSARAIGRVLRDFSAVDDLIVLASLPRPAAPGEPDTGKLLAFGQRLQSELRQSPAAAPLVDAVMYRADTDSRQFIEKVVAPAAIYYLDPDAFARARERLKPEEIRRQIREDEEMISAPGPAAGAMAKALLQDPLRLHEFLTSRLAAERPFQTWHDGDVFLSRDGRSLLIRVVGTKPPTDLEFCKALTASVEAAAKRANVDGLDVELTGSYAIAAASERAIRHDMISSVIGSVLSLHILFLLAYRSPFRFFALAFGPVAVGVLWGFGAFSLVSHSLTPMTAVIGGILAGMGIDYSIQYLSFYDSRRSSGAAPRDAAEQAATQVSPAVSAAWATSVVGFVAVGGASVKALRDFALLGTLGLAGAFLCSVTVLPAVLSLSRSRERTTKSRFRFRIDPLLLTIGRRPQACLCASLAILGAAGAVVIRSRADLLPLETDLTVMHPRPNPALEAQAHVAERFGVAGDSLIVYLTAASPQELLRTAHLVRAALAATPAREAGVAGTLGLANLLPDPAIVEQRRAAVSETEARQIASDFQAALADSLFDPAKYAGYSNFLYALLTQRSAPTIQTLLPYRHLAETMLPRQALAGAAPTEAITIVFLRHPIDDRASRDAVVEGAREALAKVPGATLTGLSVISYDSEQTIRHDLPRLIVIAVAAVAIYLLLYFRNAADALLSLVPTIFSLVCLLAATHLMGMRLNLINLAAIPLLIGIDVDYGIFLISLARRNRIPSGKVDSPLAETREQFVSRIGPVAHAVMMCATATFLGFGSLIFTSVPAARSLGWAVGIGVAACLAGAMFLLMPMLLWPKTSSSPSPVAVRGDRAG